ncbi:MAG: GH1 family beta-glucosidase [Verrucomicrobiota bacterium JB022]|nr:GH1 family beta-glucosidase [Verrucomicrobiota bacterium JB022]
MTPFPKNFFWGAAAASYQIEGWGRDSGIGRSVWDQFCDTPGKVFAGNDGSVACDHYHRYADDVRMMADLGLQAYRLSISWPRVIPQGTGAVNAKGLDFYDRLVDALLAANIRPWVTLFHWDYPLALYDRGGWLNADSPQWFADYARVVVDRLSDRVQNWFTLNEPQCSVLLGHQDGVHAPGLKLGRRDILRINHHHMVAHGLAVQVIRSHSQSPAQIGAAPVGVIKIPRTESPEDIAAARAATFAVNQQGLWCTTPYTDPMVLGQYPEELHPELPEGALDDLDTIRQPLDFFGANIYHADLVEADGQGGWRNLEFPVGHPRTPMDWNVVPEALYWGPKFLHERYNLPVVITENGMANPDWVDCDGHVRDGQRIDFVRRYLRNYRRAIDEGVPALGYFYWSIMDNFEWAFGYSKRFGLVHVDYQTQQRTLKDSAHWYRELIRQHGANL